MILKIYSIKMKPINSIPLRNLQEDLKNATTKEQVIAIARAIWELWRKKQS